MPFGNDRPGFSPKPIEILEPDSRIGWELPCGHWTTWEIQLFYSVWKPKDKDYYCEYCGRWQKKVRKAAERPETDQQGFF